jgi:hypothetical protein
LYVGSELNRESRFVLRILHGIEVRRHRIWLTCGVCRGRGSCSALRPLTKEVGRLVVARHEVSQQGFARASKVLPSVRSPSLRDMIRCAKARGSNPGSHAHVLRQNSGESDVVALFLPGTGCDCPGNFRGNPGNKAQFVPARTIDRRGMPRCVRGRQFVSAVPGMSGNPVEIPGKRG